MTRAVPLGQSVRVDVGRQGRYPLEKPWLKPTRGSVEVTQERFKLLMFRHPVSGQVHARLVLQVGGWVHARLVLQVGGWVHARLVLQVGGWVHARLVLQVEGWVQPRLVLQVGGWVHAQLVPR